MPAANKDELLYLKKLIAQGEHQHLDFKFAITDSRKIARSLVAFANSEGGTLLVGVKDNGKIAGIRSEEEMYMVDAAATMYCNPEIKYNLRLWEPEERKQVLEVIVKADNSNLWKAKTDDDQWKVWLRVNDQNIMAGKVWELVWKKRQLKSTKTIVFNTEEQLVFSHLTPGKHYTTDEIRYLTGLNLSVVEAMVSDFIVLGLMDMHRTEKEMNFSVKQKINV
jgi:predicted HTH transcriptional regulator